MKKWKRVIAVLCALVCILGVSVPAFAAVTYTTFSKAQTASGLLLPAAFGDTVHLDEAGNLLVSVSFDTSTSSQKEAAKEAWAEIMKDWKGNSDYYFFYSFGKASSSSVACFTLYAFPKSSFSHISNKTDVRNYYHAYFTAGFRFQFDLRNSALLFSGFNGHFSEGSTQGICLYPSSTKIYFFKSIADLDLQHNFPPTVASLSDVNSVIVTDDILVSPEPQTYTLTVNYRYENGSQAAQPFTRSLTAGSSYEITSPIIEGHTADRPIVSGTMPEEDLTVTVTYTAVPPPEPQTYNLTVNYRYENGSQAAQSVTRSLTAGSSYEITSPTIKGYTADRTIVSGIMPERDLTVHVLYRKDSSGSSSSSGKFPDVAAGVEWKDPLTWFDIAEGVEWKDPLTWFDIADGVEWKDPLTWFDIAEGVEWIDPFNYDWG